MPELHINLAHINPVDFLGVTNLRIQFLKNKYPDVRILHRGALIKLIGTEDALQQLKQKINFVIYQIERGRQMTDQEFTELFSPNDNTKMIAPIEPTIHDDLGEYNLVLTPDKKMISARTPGQKQIVDACQKNDVLFVVGPAGTGKTYTAVAIAVKKLKNKEIKKIILTRPAVEAGESLGYLPGDLKEKIDPYLRPLYDALEDMLPYEKVVQSIQNRIIEIAPLAYMRGRTFDNAILILDEAQNATETQLKMFLTRIGPQAKVIINGDLSQVDLPKNQKSGLKPTIKKLSNIEGIGVIELTSKDTLRHKLLINIIQALDKKEDTEK